MTNESFSRIVFDYENNKFAYFQLGLKSESRFDDPFDGTAKQSLPELVGWVCEGEEGVVSRFNEGALPTRWSYSKFSNHDQILRLTKFPDYRSFWYYFRPQLHGFVDSAHQIPELVSGRDFIEAKMLGGLIKLSFDTPKIKTLPGTRHIRHFSFDKETLMLVGRKSNLQSALKVTQGPTYDLEWNSIGGVHVPLKANSRVFKAIRFESEPEYGPAYEEFDFHWFSLNEKLDPALFSREVVMKKQRVLDILDPKKTNAITLLNKQSDSPE